MVIIGMKSKKIIAITGSISTGKSTVSRILKDEGYLVIDADKITHELMKKNNINYRKIVEVFGKNILDENLEIDRKKLGEIVFKSNQNLSKLNSITHPNIFNKMKEIIKNSKTEIIFLDIALLIELIDQKSRYLNGLNISEIWLVYCDKESQLERLMKRNNLTKKEAQTKIGAQMDIEAKIKYANFILDNTKDLDYLKLQIMKKLENL